MNRPDRNALRKVQADERRALAETLRLARRDEKATRRAAAEKVKAAEQAVAAARQARDRESYQTMCRGIVMTKVRAAGGILDVVTLGKAWPAIVPKASLDLAIEMLCAAGELVLTTDAAGLGMLGIPADLTASAAPATPAASAAVA